MRRRVALNQIRAAALVGVLIVHGGMFAALAAVRIPAEPTEAKVLFVTIVESPEAAPGADASAAPRSDRPAPPQRPTEKIAVVPVKPAPTTARPAPPVEAPPADIAGEPAAETPEPPATALSAPAPPTGPTGNGGGNAAGINGAGSTGAGNGVGSGRGVEGPMTLTSELALVCPERRPPPYPSISRRLGESGRVVLRVELDENGRVVEAHVVDSSGFARLDSAALAAVRGWRCTPPRVDGRAVGAVALQPFDFTLDGL